MIIDDYLRHRERREEQILEALRAGATTPDAIAARVYGAAAADDRAGRGDSVRAHLIKLEEEGRATKEGGSD